jgi:hypothetical protein
MEVLKNMVSTALGMALGSFIQTTTQNPNVTLIPARQPFGERIAHMIERNPNIVINPLVNAGSTLCQRIFYRNSLESHPIPVDSNGNDLVGPQNYQLNITDKSERFLNAIGFCVLITVCGITLKVVTGQKVVPEITLTEAVKEIPTEGEILNQASVILWKQFMAYIPIISLGITISVIGVYTYNQFYKAQIKKEELILRSLQKINSKLNLLPEDKEKEMVEKKLNHLSTKEK